MDSVTQKARLEKALRIALNRAHGGDEQYALFLVNNLEADAEAPEYAPRPYQGWQDAKRIINQLEALEAAWREANPEGLVGRLIRLHQRDPRKAVALARYAEPHGYEGLAGDVAAWPVVHGPSTVHARYPTEESLTERLERYGEMGLTLEEQLDEEGVGWGLGADNGYNPGDPPYEVPCPSCGGSGRWGDDIPCGRCGGWGQ